MAGATNRALKAAGIPKSTIATLRVEHGSGLSLRSALGIAHERGLPVGKAAEFHAAREAKRAASPAGQAAAADFRAKAAMAMKAAGERKAAMLAERQKRVAGTVRALGKGMLAARKTAAGGERAKHEKNLIEAAAATAGERRISRRLALAVAKLNPSLAADAKVAFEANAKAARIVIGHGAPAPKTAADRVWKWLDHAHGPAITRAINDRRTAG
jgi:hypothetical protein